MRAEDLQQTYDVGFGKPPRQSRFPKGHSGNPKGRPKGKRNLATALQLTLQEMVVINENGVRKRVTKGVAAIKQLVNKAASGDLVALRLLAALEGSAIDPSTVTPTKHLDDADLKIVQNMLKRFERQTNGEDGNDH
jgi:Family of unknown function (DUF5681)